MYEIILQLPFNGFHVKGILSLPVKAKSIIIFPHGFDPQVTCPLMSIVGELDFQVLKIKNLAFNHLKVQKQLAVVPGPSHLLKNRVKQNSYPNSRLPVQQIFAC